MSCRSALRASFVPALALALALVPGTTLALERTEARLMDPPAESWKTSQSCTVSYYNTCTGWVWVWSPVQREQLGEAFHACCSSAVLQLSWHLTFSGVPAGWGYTGTIDVLASDANQCPSGPPLATQPWLPPVTSGWHSVTWSVPVPPEFIVRVTTEDLYGFVDWSVASDHPAAGATGPTACGLCYPTTRTTHSYHYGTPTSPLCPGSPLNDGVCDAELLWEVSLQCPVGTEERSWGRLKSLYR